MIRALETENTAITAGGTPTAMGNFCRRHRRSLENMMPCLSTGVWIPNLRLCGEADAVSAVQIKRQSKEKGGMELGNRLQHREGSRKPA